MSKGIVRKLVRSQQSLIKMLPDSIERSKIFTGPVNSKLRVSLKHNRFEEKVAHFYVNDIVAFTLKLHSTYSFKKRINIRDAEMADLFFYNLNYGNTNI